MALKKSRESERVVTTAAFVSTLRRLADALESGNKFEIQVAGERVYVPVRAQCSIEHERDGDEEEIELQLHWTQQ